MSDNVLLDYQFDIPEKIYIEEDEVKFEGIEDPYEDEGALEGFNDVEQVDVEQVDVDQVDVNQVNDECVKNDENVEVIEVIPPKRVTSNKILSIDVVDSDSDSDEGECDNITYESFKQLLLDDDDFLRAFLAKIGKGCIKVNIEI